METERLDVTSDPQTSRREAGGEASPTRSALPWAALGAAVLASACCWLPLLALVFGASAVGASALFETLRPLFLTVAGVLIAGGFYLLYLRKPTCGPDGACAVPNAKARRAARLSFWAIALAVVGVSLFPKWGAALIGGNGRVTSSDAGALVFRVDGMTCEACAAHVAKAARDSGLVHDATADFETGRLVVVPRDAMDDGAAIKQAVEQATPYRLIAVAEGER